MFKSKYLRGIVPTLKDLKTQKSRQRSINLMIRKNTINALVVVEECFLEKVGIRYNGHMLK